MNEKNFPNWMLFAVVAGLGELTYWFWKHYGMGIGAKVSGAVTALALLAFLIIVATRKLNRTQR
ncbi:MAG: hypothetical protein WCC10_02290 [Tumebacillaceae bacterium]